MNHRTIITLALLNLLVLLILIYSCDETSPDISVDINDYNLIHTTFYEYEYDAQNNKTQVREYDEQEDNLYRITDYEYDSLNQLVRISVTNSNLSHNDYNSYEYNYDENGNLIKETSDSGFYKTMEYDENNNMVKISNYDIYGEFYGDDIFEYNDDNKITRLDRYRINSNGIGFSIGTSYIYEYNHEGLVETETTIYYNYGEDESVNKKYSHYRNGLLVQRESYSNNRLEGELFLTYDNNNRLFQEYSIFYAWGTSFRGVLRYYYNEQGDEVRIEMYEHKDNPEIDL